MRYEVGEREKGEDEDEEKIMKEKVQEIEREERGTCLPRKGQPTTR